MPFRPVHICRCIRARRRCAVAALAILPLLLTACQQSNVTGSELLNRQQQSNGSGLAPMTRFAAVHASLAPPQDWTQLPATHGLFYVHQQWRSPDGGTGIGVAYIQLPLPVSPQILLFVAKSQYAKSHSAVSGNIDTQWTDALGRLWFEGGDADLRVRGYVMTRGLEAWIVYSRHHLKGSASEHDIAMADRTADAVVPFIDDQSAVASADPVPH